MNLEDLMLREISQSWKDTYCMIPFMRYSHSYEVSKVAKILKEYGCHGLGEEERGTYWV